MFRYLIISLLFISCSNLQSGFYVNLRNDSDIKLISKKYGLDKKYLEKEKRVNKSNWIFIPTKKTATFKASKKIFLTITSDGKEFLWPVPAVKKISSKFGRRWGKPHEGLDIPAPTGTHFLSTESGKVIYSGRSLPSYGNMVIIDHGNGVHSVYAHANKLFVKKGDHVLKGEVIGKVGSTGKSTGPHLHFEIRKDKKPVDPEPLLSFN